MKLIVNELKTALMYQEISPSKNTIIAAIRPHLYIHNNPAGSLKLQILDQNNELIVESETLAISTMTSALYYHGYIRFYINFYAQKDQIYRIKLTSSGYTYSSTSYVAWCNDWDLSKYQSDYTLTVDNKTPLDMEIWSRKP